MAFTIVELLVLAQAVDGARRQERVELARAGRRGQADDGDLGVLVDERQRRLDAVHPRKPEVHHDDVGPVLPVGGDSGVALRDGAGDLDPVLQLQQEDQRLAEDVVVLDEEDADGLDAVVHGGNLTGYSAERSSG